jgi:transposase-like protein
MAIVHVQMPTVNLDPVATGRPRECPRCGSEILHRWGRVSKPLRDTEFEAVRVYRYRCAQAECGHTFRHYPQGVDRADQSKRLRCLAALAWSMGLSLRGVGTIFSAFGQGLGISRMSVWRAVQETAQYLRTRTKIEQHKHQVRVLGVDGAWIRLNGKTTGVMVAVDMGDGQMVGMEVLDEHDPQAVCDWLRPLVTELGVEVIVTDDLTTYNHVEQELKVERQVCYFHMRRWVGKALDDLEKKIKEGWPGWEWVVEEVRLLVEQMPPRGDEELLELWQKVQKEAGSRPQKEEATALQRLAGLIVQLMENWRRYRLHLTERGAELGVPATNNLTEQMIGNGKIRSRTVRGYKSLAGVLSAFMVCAARLA